VSDDYTTLAGPHEVETDKVKRSRFIGLARPCDSAGAARAFVDAVKARFHDARHHAFAWRVGEDARASDDGEPHHSAGPPILREIDGRGLRDVVVVVVRYYGGVKLGTGGLVRAYGGAAAAVLEAAETRRVAVRVPLRVTYDYAGASAVQRALHQLRLEPARADYGAEVCLTLHLPADRLEAVRDHLRDATGGAARLEALPPIAVTDD
jgi:uncharacterized YigZ family protein